jgi:hypothetical protein
MALRFQRVVHVEYRTGDACIINGNSYIIKKQDREGSCPKEVLQNSLRASGAQNRDAMQGGFRSRYRDISARNPTPHSARVWDATTLGFLQDFLKINPGVEAT